MSRERTVKLLISLEELRDLAETFEEKYPFIYLVVGQDGISHVVDFVLMSLRNGNSDAALKEYLEAYIDHLLEVIDLCEGENPGLFTQEQSQMINIEMHSFEFYEFLAETFRRARDLLTDLIGNDDFELEDQKRVGNGCVTMNVTVYNYLQPTFVVSGVTHAKPPSTYPGKDMWSDTYRTYSAEL